MHNLVVVFGFLVILFSPCLVAVCAGIFPLTLHIRVAPRRRRRHPAPRRRQQTFNARLTVPRTATTRATTPRTVRRRPTVPTA